MRKQADPKLKTLLEQIEKEALESSSNLADVLPKCIAWGSRRGSEALREWATHELHQRRPCGHRTSVGYRRDFATHPIPETQAGLHFRVAEKRNDYRPDTMFVPSVSGAS